MWIDLDKESQVAFIGNFAGMSIKELTFDAIATCEHRLSARQRTAYVDYVSAETARIAYAKVDHTSNAASEVYYFTLITLPLETRAQMLWHAIKGEQP